MSKILLLNHHIRGSVSNEETFWSMLARALPDCRAISLTNFKENIEEYLNNNPPGVLIFNSILGDIRVPQGVKKIALLQDNFVAMKKMLPLTAHAMVAKIIRFGNDFYTRRLTKQRGAIAGADVVVAVSGDIARWYGVDAEIIPIGVDPDLFGPMDKRSLRKKYNIPRDVNVKIYVGSAQPVKGWDFVRKLLVHDTSVYWILVFKDEPPAWLRKLDNVRVFRAIPQERLVELYNAADVYVGRSRVETLWLAPIEAMFCDVPVDVTPVGIFADWYPENKNPRREAFGRGLDKKTMIEKWKKLIERYRGA